MFEFIERLRKKPYHTRVFISIASAGGITAAIALIWVVSFFASIRGTDLALNDSKPLEALGEKLTEGAELTKDLIESFEELQNVASTTLANATTTASSTSEIPVVGGSEPKEVELPGTSTPSKSTSPKKTELRIENGVEVIEL